MCNVWAAIFITGTSRARESGNETTEGVQEGTDDDTHSTVFIEAKREIGYPLNFLYG